MEIKLIENILDPHENEYTYTKLMEDARRFELNPRTPNYLEEKIIIPLKQLDPFFQQFLRAPFNSLIYQTQLNNGILQHILDLNEMDDNSKKTSSIYWYFQSWFMFMSSSFFNTWVNLQGLQEVSYLTFSEGEPRLWLIKNNARFNLELRTNRKLQTKQDIQQELNNENNQILKLPFNNLDVHIISHDKVQGSPEIIVVEQIELPKNFKFIKKRDGRQYTVKKVKEEQNINQQLFMILRQWHYGPQLIPEVKIQYIPLQIIELDNGRIQTRWVTFNKDTKQWTQVTFTRNKDGSNKIKNFKILQHFIPKIQASKQQWHTNDEKNVIIPQKQQIDEIVNVIIPQEQQINNIMDQNQIRQLAKTLDAENINRLPRKRQKQDNIYDDLLMRQLTDVNFGVPQHQQQINQQEAALNYQQLKQKERAIEEQIMRVYQQQQQIARNKELMVQQQQQENENFNRNIQFMEPENDPIYQQYLSFQPEPIYQQALQPIILNPPQIQIVPPPNFRYSALADQYLADQTFKKRKYSWEQKKKKEQKKKQTQQKQLKKKEVMQYVFSKPFQESQYSIDLQRAFQQMAADDQRDEDARRREQPDDEIVDDVGDNDDDKNSYYNKLFQPFKPDKDDYDY